MKKRNILLLLVTMTVSLALVSCIATRDTTKINKVEIGMDKEDIKHLLGTPLFKNADGEIEEWGYRKLVGEVAGPEEMLFIVTFDTDGKVIGYKSVKEHPYYHRR